ncbi:MAG: hypothetical protein IPK16_20535 [Anaerolineales bacterium]|nr:hypothetical protein [Anaerolineales bacterium]
MSGWWTELYNSAGKLVASNFTNSRGKWNLYTLKPGEVYTVCQKPQAGWTNTQPGRFLPEHGNWPCYTFALQPAQLIQVFFGYTHAAQLVAPEATDTVVARGMRVSDNFIDNENDAMYTEEEFIDVDGMTPDDGSTLFMPALTR